MNTRHLILGLVAALLTLLAALGFQLQRDLRTLSTAENDSIQWAAFQLETEYANLVAFLHTQNEPLINSDKIRLRADIALSRSTVVEAGRSQDFWQGSPQAQELLSEIKTHEAMIIALIDQAGALNDSDIAELIRIAQVILPKARELALIGITRGAQIGLEERERLSMLLLQFWFCRTGFDCWIADGAYLS